MGRILDTHLSTIFASMAEGMLVVDQNMVLTNMNPAAARFLGKDHAEVIGKDIRTEVSIWNGARQLIAESYPVTRAQSEKRPITATVEDNFTFQIPGRPSFPVSFTMAPLGSGSELSGVVILFSDITEARKLREARTAFISIASHQLRTPLTPIRWFAKLLLSGSTGPLTPEQDEFVRYIYENNDRMIQLLNTLLQLSRVEEGRVAVNPKPTDLVDLLKKVVVALTPIADTRHISIVVKEPVINLPLVPVDEVILWQVIQNLLTNAIRYSFEGKSISLGFEHKGTYMLGFVQDSGIGIPKLASEKIYQRFYRSAEAIKMAPEGSGLGLALVRSLVDGWGGRIWHESEEGKGTTFHFTIPLSGMKAKSGETTLQI